MPPKAKAGPKAKAAGKARAKAKGKAKAAGAKRAASPASSGRSGGDAKRTKAADGSARTVGAAAGRSSGTSRGRKVDERAPSGMKVYEDYSFTLNQTNVGANNNKYYIIQVLEGSGKYYAWNRWGRVGDFGQNKLEEYATPEQAIRSAKSKFKAKTGNDMDNLAAFVAKKGRYTLVETDDSGGGSSEAPMGKLTEAQIKKGQDALAKLETALQKKNAEQINDFSSQFYSLIPTNFGWKKPVAITTAEMLEEKQELLKFLMRMGFEKVEADEGLTPIDGLLQLPLPKSLDDAASGICSKVHITSSNKKGRELKSQNAGNPKKTMGEALYAAIMLYTSNAIYSDLNKALRDKNRAKIKKYFKYLRLLFEAMECLSPEKKTLWRGLGVDLSGDGNYSPGKTVTWWGVSSCTSDMKVARGFAGSCSGGASVITIHAKTSCDISAISFFGNEKESLLRPGTMLKVKSRSKKGSITDITLEEVGSAIQ
uniref:NAD(P)(+)--arginine ADP-ribosyltransferase n=1 Tax=Crypthecodinium cohnii TaxID=2866 RepID=A0A516AGS6_CRYCO|nr:poly [ADP-ribose] polymerase 3 [Crypthecodinium cohnii]USW07838.1 poly [ADP-ribose] polymerase 3 [Crypthecodinium cohnii]